MSILKKIKENKKKKEVRLVWLETLVNSGCIVDMVDKGKKTFDLLEIEKINNGYKAMCFIPRGLSVDHLKNKKNELQDALSAYISIEKDRYQQYVWIKIIDKEPKFEFEHIKTDLNQLWLGYKHEGTPFKVNLDDDPHFIFGGGTGSGKTYAVACILTNLFLNNTDKKGKVLADFYLCQVAKADLKLFEKVRHVKKVINDLDSICEKLKELLELSEKRNKKMINKGVTSIAQWNELYRKTDFMKRVYFIADELAFFMPEAHDDEDIQIKKKECWSLLRQLAYAGRSGGIHIIGIVQRATAGCLGGDGAFKSQLSRFSLKQNSADESRYIVDVADASTLKKREAYFKGSKTEILIVPTLKNKFKDLKKFIPEIIVAEDYLDIDIDKEVTSTVLEKPKKIYQDELIRIPEAEWEINKYTEAEIAYGRKTGLSLKHIRENKLVQEENKTIDGLVLQDRDKQIMSFIESYGAITINQANRIFWDGNKKDACRKRLKKLADVKILICADIKDSKEKQYFLENQKPKKLHELYLIDCYCRLVQIGANIITFKTAHRLLEGKILPDGYLEYKIGDKLYKSYVEVDYTHYTSQTKIGLYEKYKKLSCEDFNIIIGKEDAVKVKSKELQIIPVNINFANFKI